MRTAITFSRRNDAGSRKSNTSYWENLVLIVVLVLESKALYLSGDGQGFPPAAMSMTPLGPLKYLNPRLVHSRGYKGQIILVICTDGLIHFLSFHSVLDLLIYYTGYLRTLFQRQILGVT